MRIFALVILAILLCASPARAVDLSIADGVVSNLDITVSASLSASSNYYPQGTLRSQSSSKYFGETQNDKGDWIDYVSSPEKEYITSNFFMTDIKNATWSGTLKLRFKTDDPNYLGPGTYDLKIRRFTGGSSSSAGESNTISLTLSAPVPTPTPSPIASVTPTPSPSPSPSSVTIASSPSPSAKPSVKPSPSPQLASPQIGTVAGAISEINLAGFGLAPSPSVVPSLQTASSQPPPSLNKSRLKTAVLVGAGLIIISIASFFAYRKYRNSSIIPL